MNLDFCTSIGHTSIPKLLTLHESLVRHSSLPFSFWVLCDGNQAYQIMKELDLPNFHLISMEEFEEGDAPLLMVKPTRNRFEYNCTLRPSWLLYLLRKHPEISVLTYMDTDLYFFDDPKILYSQLEKSSILLSEHRYYENFYKEVWNPHEPGIYNAGWIAFKNDECALNALTWWRERCLEWCYDYYEDGKYGEQRYLNDWTERFPGTNPLKWLGANVAPWNILNYTCSLDHTGKILVNNEPLIFYHFHALQWDGEFSFKVAHGVSARRRQLTNSAYRLTQQHIDLLYKPYIADLEKSISIVKKHTRDEEPHQVLEDDPNALFDYAELLVKLGKQESAFQAFTLAAFLQLERGDISLSRIFLRRALSVIYPETQNALLINEQSFVSPDLPHAEIAQLLPTLQQKMLYRIARRFGAWSLWDAKIKETLSLPDALMVPQAIELLRVLHESWLYRLIVFLGRWRALNEGIEYVLSSCSPQRSETQKSKTQKEF